MVAGDFGTGQISLAVTDADSNQVSVLLGNGDGTFQPALYAATGSDLINLVAGDFTGNSRLDLATEIASSNDITVLLGKGDGTFEEPAASNVGDGTVAEVTGDFTGNGNLGLAVLDQGSDTVTILPGNGDGTFQEPLTVDLPAGAQPTSIVAADFNGDGRTDLAVADFGLNEVSILMGNGDGTFDSLPPISVPGGPVSLAAGDFTGNGIVDLAVADEDASTVTILLGNGDGTFNVLPPIPLANPYSFPDAIVAGNFTSNGIVDLAVADSFTDDVTVLLGNGNGTFVLSPQSPISVGNWASSDILYMTLVVGQFTNDGNEDLAVATTDFGNGDSVDVLLGNGDGTFTPVLTDGSLPTISLGYFTVFPIGIVAGYFTGSGNMDLATADANGSGTDDYSIYLGNGDGTFQGPTPYALGGSGGSSSAIVAGDFTGNGLTDLAITRTGPDSVEVQLSNGDGTFSSPSEVDLVRRETPLVADLNGAQDVLVVDAAGNILYRAGRPGEPGSFAPPVTINPATRRATSPSSRLTTARRSQVWMPTTIRSRSSSWSPAGSSWLPSSSPVPSRLRSWQPTWTGAA